VVEALALFRDQTGLRIGQPAWHALREAAEARLKAEGRLAPDAHLTNGKADASLVVAAAIAFAKSINVSEETTMQFVARLGRTGMSVGNAHTLDEVTRKVIAGERVGVRARQPKNGKNVTAVDMLDRAGGYEDPEDEHAGFVMPRKVSPAVAAWLSGAGPLVPAVPAPSPGQLITRALEPMLRDLAAHGGKVTPAGALFEVGDRLAGGLVVVVKADSAVLGEPVTVTIGRWKDDRHSDIVLRQSRLSLLEAELVIRGAAGTIVSPAA
jgi:hypothetical protein